jgi:hypothetical protein
VYLYRPSCLNALQHGQRIVASGKHHPKDKFLQQRDQQQIHCHQPFVRTISAVAMTDASSINPIPIVLIPSPSPPRCHCIKQSSIPDAMHHREGIDHTVGGKLPPEDNVHLPSRRAVHSIPPNRLSVVNKFDIGVRRQFNLGMGYVVVPHKILGTQEQNDRWPHPDPTVVAAMPLLW